MIVIYLRLVLLQYLHNLSLMIIKIECNFLDIMNEDLCYYIYLKDFNLNKNSFDKNYKFISPLPFLKIFHLINFLKLEEDLDNKSLLN